MEGISEEEEDVGGGGFTNLLEAVEEDRFLRAELVGVVEGEAVFGVGSGFEACEGGEFVALPRAEDGAEGGRGLRVRSDRKNKLGIRAL